MEHFKPHPSALFEGYYSKFSLPSGATLAIIICSVPKASKRPYMLSFTYVPSSTRTSEILQRELWVSSIERVETGQDQAFELRVPGIGYVGCAADSTTTYDLEHENFSLHAETSSRTAWSSTKSTPEGWLVYLPLPLHWHVHSLSSNCSFKLDIPSIPSQIFPAEDRQGKALVHQEKNWAQSFPSAHIWIQARDGERGICCAGGSVLGMQAYLLGYRSPKYCLDFTPPFALAVFNLSPFMSVNIDWESRTVKLSIQDLWRRIVVRARAPKGSFFSLGAPFPEGHKENNLAESFEAIVDVELFERSWVFGGWNEVRRESFEKAALEFGGDFYGSKGTEKKRN